jgi:ABC-type glycerol-3-phosphate transport system substrate-binding protein
VELAQFDGTVPGHMVPPLVDVAVSIEQMGGDYVNAHHDWVSFFNEHVEYINHPSNNMGSVSGCNFRPQLRVTPWGGDIFSSDGVIDRMLHSIFLGEKTAEEAWQDAVAEMQAIQEAWGS